jgi:hypothetical protein
MKLFKQLAIVALVCCGQSALAMTPTEISDIKTRIERMKNPEIANRCATLKDVTLELDTHINRYDIHFEEHSYRYFCHATTYLMVIDLLKKLREKDIATFNKIVEFSLKHPEVDYRHIYTTPQDLMVALLGKQNDYTVEDEALKHIINHGNVAIAEYKPVRKKK